MKRHSAVVRGLSTLLAVALIASCSSDGGSTTASSALASTTETSSNPSDATTVSKGQPASGGDVAAGGSLVWARNSAIDSWDGDKCVGPSTQTNPVVYDTLVRMSVPDGQSIVAGLAEKFSYDPTTFTYTFNLRPNAAFSNGQPLTADDVKFSVDQWVAGPVSGAYYQSVKSATVVDKETVQVKMKQADTFFPALLTWCTSTIYPKDFAGVPQEQYFQKPISAGPFAVSEWNNPGGPNEEIVLEKNKYYWGAADGLPKLDKLTIRTIADPNQRALAFDSGVVDILENVDTPTKRQLDPSLLVNASRQQMYGFIINTEKVKDVKLRQAIGKAIDRQEIVEILDRGAEVAPGVLPINVPDAAPPTNPNTFDLDGAKALIAQTDAAKGINLGYLYDASDADQTTIAQNLQSQLAKIGVTLKLNGADSATVSANAASGDYDLAAAGTAAISPTIFDPIGLMVALNYPWARADMTVINHEFLVGTASTDSSARQGAVRKIQDDAMAQAAQIGLVNVASTYAVQKKVRGFALLPYVLWYTDTVGFAP